MKHGATLSWIDFSGTHQICSISGHIPVAWPLHVSLSVSGIRIRQSGSCVDSFAPININKALLIRSVHQIIVETLGKIVPILLARLARTNWKLIMESSAPQNPSHGSLPPKCIVFWLISLLFRLEHARVVCIQLGLVRMRCCSPSSRLPHCASKSTGNATNVCSCAVQRLIRARYRIHHPLT